MNSFEEVQNKFNIYEIFVNAFEEAQNLHIKLFINLKIESY
jgi:hypothetical protein